MVYSDHLYKKFNYIRALEIFCNHIYISADSSSTPTTSSETDLKINLKLTLHSQIKEFQSKFFSKCKLFQWKKSRWIKHLFVNVWYSHLSVFTPTRSSLLEVAIAWQPISGGFLKPAEKMNARGNRYHLSHRTTDFSFGLFSKCIIQLYIYILPHIFCW